MRKIIKDGAVVEDGWRGRLLDLDSWNEAAAGVPKARVWSGIDRVTTGR